VDLGSVVIDAVADHRPAVVLAGLRNVDLVAAARPVFVHPQLAARRIDRRALRIAMTVTPDFRLGAVLADEGIVGRGGAVGTNTNQLAQVIAEILRLVAIREMLAHGEKQAFVGHLDDAAAEMIAARQRSLLAEYHADVIELRLRVIDEPRAGERRAAA